MAGSRMKSSLGMTNIVWIFLLVLGAVAGHPKPFGIMKSSGSINPSMGINIGQPHFPTFHVPLITHHRPSPFLNTNPFQDSNPFANPFQHSNPFANPFQHSNPHANPFHHSNSHANPFQGTDPFANPFHQTDPFQHTYPPWYNNPSWQPHPFTPRDLFWYVRPTPTPTTTTSSTTTTKPVWPWRANPKPCPIVGPCQRIFSLGQDFPPVFKRPLVQNYTSKISPILRNNPTFDHDLNTTTTPKPVWRWNGKPCLINGPCQRIFPGKPLAEKDPPLPNPTPTITLDSPGVDVDPQLDDDDDDLLETFLRNNAEIFNGTNFAFLNLTSLSNGGTYVAIWMTGWTRFAVLFGVLRWWAIGI